MKFKFTGQSLFYLAAFVCIISVILFPVGILFIYLARTAHISFEENNFIYKMFTTKVIPLSEIRQIRVSPVAQGRYMINSTVMTLVTVVPLVIEYGNNKKIKLSLNYFENPGEIVRILTQKTGKEIQVPDELKEYMSKQ